MAGYAKATIIGNMTKDPEVRTLPGGKSVLDFTLAVNSKANGVEEVSFFDCTAWEKTADLIVRFFKKGSSFGVDGRIKLKPWEDKSGNKRVQFNLTVNEIIFIGKADDNTREQSTPKPAPQQQQQTIVDDTSVPF